MDTRDFIGGQKCSKKLFKKTWKPMKCKICFPKVVKKKERERERERIRDRL
jgi:hypothetical protein